MDPIRVPRYDRGLARLDFAPGAELRPGTAPAQVDPQTGYVRASAYLARDGLLTYGDGTEQWQEIRPREELIRAVRSFDIAPLTDLHPDAMVTADTWEQHARGIVIAGTPHVTEPDPETGISYLAADILITSADMLATIRDGQQELSIGFWARITDAPEGTGARFAQVDLLGNHVASVPRGRAGSACRVFLDHAAVCAYDRPVQDAQPVDQVEYPMPDGTIRLLPTDVVALITQMQSTIETLSAQATEPEEPDMPDMPAPPEPPVDPAAETQPVVQAPEPEPEKRDADGVRIDSATAVALIVERMPWLAGKLDEAGADELGPLVRAALAAPAPVRTDAAPAPAPAVHVQPEPVRVQTRADATAKPIANFLAQYGYAPRR